MEVALLQDPYLSLAAPHAVTFGGAAVTAGHEMGHAFDSSGQTFDAQGQLRTAWSPPSLSAFAEKEQCLVDLYSSMEVPPYVPANATIDARRIQREAQADHYGLPAGWEAWSARIAAGETGPPNTRLDVRFTPAQLFFASYAHGWWVVMRPEMERYHLATRAHPPEWARVRGPLSQLAPFAQAFNCSAGKPYNPPTRCSLW